MSGNGPKSAGRAKRKDEPLPANNHRRHGTLAALPFSIPAQLSGADQVSCTVTTLEDEDIVLVRLDSGHLSIELPLPSNAALDLSLRLCASLVRLRRSNKAD